MTGTLINTLAVLAGALLGLALKSRLPQRVSGPVMKIEGVAILVISLNGLVTTMISAVPTTGALNDSGNLLLLVSLVLGCLAGELMRLDDALNRLGQSVEARLKAEGFARGFLSASLIFCVGAMSIIGPLQDGLGEGYQILLVKSTLDFTTATVLASALGFGVAFAAVPVLVLQGTVSLLASRISPYVSDALLGPVCMVGYAIVLCIGLNFAADTKIKTANLLPALLVPVIYHAFFNN